jgi:hypothetical protein
MRRKILCEDLFLEIIVDFHISFDKNWFSRFKSEIPLLSDLNSVYSSVPTVLVLAAGTLLHLLCTKTSLYVVLSFTDSLRITTAAPLFGLDHRGNEPFSLQLLFFPHFKDSLRTTTGRPLFGLGYPGQ